MRYRVFWSPYAEQRLEEITLSASNPEAVVAAAREINRRLVHHPLSVGESREDTTRIAFLNTLGVQFDILDDVKTVIVYDVWPTRQR